MRRNPFLTGLDDDGNFVSDLQYYQLSGMFDSDCSFSGTDMVMVTFSLSYEMMNVTCSVRLYIVMVTYSLMR